jgi:DNA end-binding protein Ku
MRAIWKGAVSFGLVNVPVRLFAATEEHDIRFHQVHREDGGRIRYKRSCDVCGEEVGFHDIAKGYESSDGQLVILTDEDLEQLPVATGHEIDVMEFVPGEQVDPILFAKSYYLEPDAKAAKPYALLREALAQTDRMAVVKVALRQKETLAVLRVRDKAIVLQTMLWPDEVRAADFQILNDEVQLRPQELQMASSLVESMTADFRPDVFVDDYQAAVLELIESKLDKGQSTAVAGAPSPAARGGGEVIDLLTALQRSVDSVRAKSGEPAVAEQAAAPAKKTPAKKAAAAKAPAKKAPVKEAAGKTDAGKNDAAKSDAGPAAATKRPARKRTA